MQVPEEVRETMQRMELINDRIKRLTAKHAKLRTKLEKQFLKYEKENFEVDDGQPKILRANRTVPSTLVYDNDLLKQKLPKNIFKKICTWHVDVNKVNTMFDEGLIPKELFRKMISWSVDTKKIDQVFQQGLIPLKLLKKAASLITSSPRITVMRVKK